MDLTKLEKEKQIPEVDDADASSQYCLMASRIIQLNFDGREGERAREITPMRKHSVFILLPIPQNERARGLLALQAKCPIEERERESAHQF